MLNFLTRIFIILTIFYSGTVLAMNPIEEDVEPSKRRFLISEISDEQRYNAYHNGLNGIMTLCFKPVDNSYMHAALVFEFFLPKLGPQIQLATIDHGFGEECGLGCVKNLKPRVGNRAFTLQKAYRSAEYDSLNRNLLKGYKRAEYRRYASWVLPNTDLLRGYDLATKDVAAYTRITTDENAKNPYHDTYNPKHKPIATDADRKLKKELSGTNYTCYHYVQRIMKEIGLRNVEFAWWWLPTCSNLKFLVDNHIKPVPITKNYSQITLPEFPAKKEK